MEREDRPTNHARITEAGGCNRQVSLNHGIGTRVGLSLTNALKPAYLITIHVQGVYCDTHRLYHPL